MSVTTKVNFRTFQPPPNYTEKTDYSEEQLFLEDLNNEDNEVWLFQTPREFDSSSLKNKTISLQGETVFQNDNCLQEEKSHKISASTNSVNEIDYQLLLPSRSNTGLFPVSLPFAGHLRLMETISTPPLASPYFPPEKEKEDFSNLRQRYVPFGSDKPFPIKATSDNSVNGKNSLTPTSSKKKRVSFKFPFTEMQEQNIPEAENSYQPDLNKDNLCKTTKQKKLLRNNTSQENAMPKEVKSKKKKHNKLSSNDSAATDDPSNESNVSSHQTEQFEEAESAQNHNTLFCSDSRSLKENESFGNGDTQVSSSSKSSRKKRKSDKSSRSECAKDGSKVSESIQKSTVSQDEEIFRNMSDGIASGSDSSQSDTKSKKKKKKSKEQTDENYPASEETELSHTTPLIQYSKTNKQNKNDGTVLSGNDNYQTDTRRKKNKRKSNQFENVSASGETKSSRITQLNQSSESNVSPQNHSNKNFTNTKFSPTTDNKIEPFANEAENANSSKQDLCYTDTQKPHKKIKRKKLSEGDGSQDDTSKSRKRKVSDKSWANACTDTSDEKSSFNDSLIKSQQNDISQSSEHSCHSSDTNILPVQGELSENKRYQSDTEDTKSKKKKNRSKSASLKEDAKMYGIALPSDKKKSVPAHNDQTPVEIKKSLKTEPFEPANNSSENSDFADDKSSRKKGKTGKKHTHEKHSSQQELSQKFTVNHPLYKEEEKKCSETDLSSQEDLPSINLDTVKREYKSSDGHENTSRRKEKKHHNQKKDKKRKEIGNHSKVSENDSIPIDENPCIGIQNIKQEILSDSNSETSTKGITKPRKKKASKQLPEDVKDCSTNKFSENLTEETLDIKPSLGLKTEEMVHLDHTTIKNEFPSTSIEKKRNKKNKNKVPTHLEALQITIKEEVLSDSQTNNDEIVANANTSVVVKQEVLSDCDTKISFKQEHSSDTYAPLAKVIKKEIKSEPDSDSSVTKKHCKRKHCENSEESYSENPDNLTGSCNKVKKLKMHKRSRH